MNNISTNLLRFNGEIGPQYLDPDDKTGGPDGTMKPITKDVLREMIMLNLPEIQKVQDEYVKAELESIKQTQQQILQRLDGTFNTQLTGSNVELRLLDADLGGSPITVGQGLTYTIDNIDVKNYAKCYLGVLVENQTKWSMSLTFLNRAIYTAHTVQNITTINQKTDFVDVLSNSARITITNNGTTDMNIKRIYLFLSKMR